MLRTLLTLLTPLLLLSACGRSGADDSGFTREGTLRFVRGDSTIARIEIEIADDTPQRARGLMYRQEMAMDRGMLFVFEKPEPRRFWMKHTAISLDILFLDEDGVVREIVPKTTPYSQIGIPSEHDALYVLEVNAGYTGRHGIRPGDRIVWRRD